MIVTFAFRNIGFLCGMCHYHMDGSVSKNTIPAEYRVKCGNKECPNFGKIFKVGEEAKVSLIEVHQEKI